MALARMAARQLAPAAAAAAAGAAAARAGQGPAGVRLFQWRAAASKSAHIAQLDEAYSFEQAPLEAPVFPELLQPGRRAILLAVDPDLHGAVAAVSWLNPPAPAGAEGSSTPAGSATDQHGAAGGTLPALCQLAVELHDMPTEVWQYGARDKKQPEAHGLIRILSRYADMAAGTGAFGLGFAGTRGAVASSWEAAEPEPAPKRRRQRGGAGIEAQAAEPAAAEAAAAAQQGGAPAPWADEQPPVVRAVIEYSMPGHVCGKFAWYGIGFAVGLLNGLLAAQGIPYHRVPASTWKKSLGLNRQPKDASIALARHLLPTAAIFLGRKKDHGRAEALLIAAWALGVRMEPLAAAGAATDEEACTESESDGTEQDSDSVTGFLAVTSEGAVAQNEIS